MSLLHRTRDNDDTAVVDEVRSSDHVVQSPPESEAPASEHAGATEPVPERIRERTWTFAPGQLVSFAVGVGAIAMGLVAVIRAGLDGNLARPVVEVLSLSHTAWLGLAEIALGVLLVVAGTGAWGRFLSVPLGAAMAIAGILVVAEPAEMPEELALEPDHGWALLLLGALVALASMVLPVWRTRKVDHRELDPRAGRRRLLTH